MQSTAIPAGARAEPQRFDADVLLVEGDQIDQVVAQRILEALGVRCALAGNGKQALEIIERSRFDLVLMNCQMPEMDGYSATVELRRREARRASARIPVIALPANALEGDRERCLAAGMDDCLPKPFRRDALAAMLMRWLPEGKRAPAFGGASAATSSRSAAAAVDRKALEAIRELGGPGAPDLLEQVIRLYLETTPELIETLRSALSAGRLDAVRSAAHTLKSGSANLGATALSDQCRRLENAARSGALGPDLPTMEQVDAEYRRVRAALEQELGAGV